MWNLKFKVKNIDSIYSPLTEKYKIKDYLYPADRYIKNGFIHILGIHILNGDEKEIEKFTRELKKNKKIERFKVSQGKIITLIKEEEKFYELLYNPELFLPKPVVIENGWEYWDVCSWNRLLLVNLINELEKWSKMLQGFQVLKLHKEGLEEIYFPQILPIISEKQRTAFRIAVLNGYYKFPRNADLKDLAKVMQISTQTYHEHLRKAEEKLLPFFFSGTRPPEN